MRSVRYLLPVAWILLVLATSANFVFTTAITPHVSDSGLVIAGALATAMLLVAVGGIPRRGVLMELGARRGAICLAAGALAVAVAPALIATSRYSDSPPGSVAAFWTTAVWGLLLIAATSLRSGSYVRVAAALLGAVASAGVVGNWERPSSFSLLVLHLNQEIALLIAGVAWITGLLFASRLARMHGRFVYSIVGLGGVLGAVAWGLPAASWDVALLTVPASAFPAVASQALMFGLALHLASSVSAHLPGAALLTAIPVISSLLFVTEWTAVFGPRPILAEAATWAGLLMLASIALVLLPLRNLRISGGRTAMGVASLGLAVVAFIAALAALTLPGVEVAVRGTTYTGAAFAADFAMRGFQTVGGWLVLAVAIIALAASYDRFGNHVRAVAIPLTAALAAGAYVHVRYTPLHVWMQWIPPEVQQEYGSPFASIVFTPVATPVQVIALVFACAAIVLVSSGWMLGRRFRSSDSRSSSGGQDR